MNPNPSWIDDAQSKTNKSVQPCENTLSPSDLNGLQYNVVSTSNIITENPFQ